jgi:hypothetical protein
MYAWRTREHVSLENKRTCKPGEKGEQVSLENKRTYKPGE